MVFQPVTVGIFWTSDVQVTSGIHPGEQILLVSPDSLKTSGKESHFGGGKS